MNSLAILPKLPNKLALRLRDRGIVEQAFGDLGLARVARCQEHRVRIADLESYKLCAVQCRSRHAARSASRSMRRVSATIASSTRFDWRSFLATLSAWLALTPVFSATRLKKPTKASAFAASGGVFFFFEAGFWRVKLWARNTVPPQYEESYNVSTEKTGTLINKFAPLSLGERIRVFRKARGWNQTQLAAAAGVTQTQVSLWEKNVNRPSPSALGAIARHAEENERNLWIAEAGLSEFVSSPDDDVREVPVLRDAAAAGTPRAVDERAVETTLKLPRQWLPRDGGLYGIFVKGDSMSPVVNEGDLVILNVARRNPTDLVGHMVAARDAEGGITIKYLRRDDDVYLLVPQYTSERHPIRLLKESGGWSVVGEVVKIICDPPKPRRK